MQDTLIALGFAAICAALFHFAQESNRADCAAAWGDNKTEYSFLGGCRVELAGTWFEVDY